MRDKSDIADQVIGIVSSVIKSSMENSRVSYYEKQLETIEKKKQKLLDMCLSGDIETDEYKKGFERLNNEYKETNKKLKDEKERHSLAENQSSIIESIREHIQGIVVNGCWDEIFYGNLVEKIEVFNDRSLNIHLNLMPKTCCAKVLKGKEINDQNAQEIRAKSAFCTYRGSSVPTEDPQYRKTSDFNANSELKWLEILKTYQLYCYTRKNYKIIRNAGERDKHKTKVFTVSVHAV